MDELGLWVSPPVLVSGVAPLIMSTSARYRQIHTEFRELMHDSHGRATFSLRVFLPHRLLAMNWFSGRLVPGVASADEESADAQMNFGFVNGDDSVPGPYFYTTAHPIPDSWTNLALPDGAYWHTEGWNGAVLPYSSVVASPRPWELMQEYLRSLQTHGAKLMS